MQTDDRLNPDELLEVIQREEQVRKKGRLKIFLGMAAGVGKTYTMLQEAQKLKANGVDIVVGTVNTHGRKETAFLVEGLESIPEKPMTYKGITFLELDLDAILQRKPRLVLVDELAHTNIPGSRHDKRWQDVMEILDNGIDVYTTLNVQHIESLKDVVEGIAGIPIKETVPDSIIEAANFIELVDITPDELLQRLKEGKVYLGDQPKIAIQHFFQADRLTALREIVLRFAAEKIDHDLIEMTAAVGRTGGWHPCERLLVGVNHRLDSKRLIRTARRLAFTLHAPWIAVHIDDGTVLDESENLMLAKNLSMARDLGAEIITTNDPNIVEGIERIARQKNITQIIIGRPLQGSFFGLFQKYTLLEHLVKECTDVDIHVIRQERSSTAYRRRFKERFSKQQFLPYLLTLCCVLLLTAVSFLVLPFLGYRVVGFIFLLGILVLSLFFKKGPIFFASVLYACIWDLFFIPPQGTLGASYEDNSLLLLYFLTAVVAGIWVDRMREHREMLLKRERSTEVLYEVVRLIAGATSPKELVKSLKERLDAILSGTCEILIKRFDDGLDFEDSLFLQSDNKERNLAIWVFENGKEAGWSTSTLPESRNLCIPLKGFHETVGILTYRPKNPAQVLTIEEKNLLYTVGQQLANYFERAFSGEKKQQFPMEKKEPLNNL